MKKLALASVAMIAATPAAFAAATCPVGQTCTQVPEINAYAGVAAVAVLAAAVALIWERRRAA